MLDGRLYVLVVQEQPKVEVRDRVVRVGLHRLRVVVPAEKKRTHQHIKKKMRYKLVQQCCCGIIAKCTNKTDGPDTAGTWRARGSRDDGEGLRDEERLS